MGSNPKEINSYGHRQFPDGIAMFDERCDGCQAPRMSEVWEERLRITPSHLRITVSVKKLREIIGEIIEERTRLISPPWPNHIM